MDIQHYDIKYNASLTQFEFISVGPRGKILKNIVFQPIYDNIYNIAFGDVSPDNPSRLDDLIVTNNGDTDKVLKTVAIAIEHFLQKNPNALVLFRGSTKSRTRLYRMRLRKYYAEITAHIALFGIIEGKSYCFSESVNLDFDSFLVKSKGEIS
ncbi:DUF6934 family protein [Pelistega suis]|uniref:DUF6934 family protein n=1 Tax=Pelistega suis TaxID=1631957 RepID=UPI00211C516F|nr:hypothetical protein [Pelistega suis]MCQ9328730.1 hypothetical protein [Pelistega suis]